MFFGIPVHPTEELTRLPDELRLSGVLTEFSRERGGPSLHSFLEGPAFDANGLLWCVDLAHGRVLNIDPDLRWRAFHQYEGRPNGLKIAPDGALTIADAMNGILRMDPVTAVIEPLVTEYRGQKLAGPNDLVFAANGDLYFTDPGRSDYRRPTGRVFRRRSSGQVELLLEDLPYPNGLALSPAGDALYVALTRTLQVLRIALQPDIVGEHRCGVFIQLSGGLAGPDGIAVATNGDIFVAHSGLGTVWRFDHLGEPLVRYRSTAGVRTTNLAFTQDGNSMVITESETGTILRCRIG